MARNEVTDRARDGLVGGLDVGAHARLKHDGTGVAQIRHSGLTGSPNWRIASVSTSRTLRKEGAMLGMR